jgi:hypothetical protein
MKLRVSLLILLTLPLLDPIQGWAALKAGFAEAPFELPEGTPLGGYGGASRRLPHLKWEACRRPVLFKPAQGTLDPVRSKAMVIQSSGKKLAFLSLDLVAVSSDFRNRLLERLDRLGYHTGNLMVSATHTHSGPGGLSRNPFWELTALDTYRKEVESAVLNSAASAVSQAESNAVPARIETTSFLVPGVQNNRRNHPERVDPRARLIYATADSGALLGSLILFSIHGIALSDDNLKFSADVPGGIERSVNSAFAARNAVRGHHGLGFPVSLFINGAVGDITPSGSGAEAIEKIGAQFAAAAENSLERGTPLPEEWFVAQTRLRLPWAGFHVRNCILEFRKKKPNRALRFIPKGMEFKPVGIFFPRSVELSLIRWGNLALATWPGEPTELLGSLLLNQLNMAPHEGAILGLTNEHLAYFLTQEEFGEGGYESCFSLYGEKGGQAILRTHLDLMKRLF